jgi:hypothetical protein
LSGVRLDQDSAGSMNSIIPNHGPFLSGFDQEVLADERPNGQHADGITGQSADSESSSSEASSCTDSSSSLPSLAFQGGVL